MILERIACFNAKQESAVGANSVSRKYLTTNTSEDQEYYQHQPLMEKVTR